MNKFYKIYNEYQKKYFEYQIIKGNYPNGDYSEDINWLKENEINFLISVGYIQRRIEERQKARKNKEWGIADGIRSELLEIGINFNDREN